MYTFNWWDEVALQSKQLWKIFWFSKIMQSIVHCMLWRAATAMCAEKYALWSLTYHSFIVYLIPEPQCSQVFEEAAEEFEQMTALSHSVLLFWATSGRLKSCRKQRSPNAWHLRVTALLPWFSPMQPHMTLSEVLYAAFHEPGALKLENFCSIKTGNFCSIKKHAKSSSQTHAAESWAYPGPPAA